MPDYRVSVEKDGKRAEFTLDESRWATTYRPLLDGGRITVSNGRGPMVSVDTSGRRWVLFQRHFQSMNPAGQASVLCVGWQDTVNGVNVKALTWLYPDGSVELAEEPVRWREYLR